MIKIYETEKMIDNYLEAVWENIGWDGTEAILYRDGETFIRAIGSKGNFESEIVATLTLSEYYWADTYLYTDGELDKDMKDTFIEDYTEWLKAAIDVYDHANPREEF